MPHAICHIYTASLPGVIAVFEACLAPSGQVCGLPPATVALRSASCSIQVCVAWIVRHQKLNKSHLNTKGSDTAA